MTMQIPEYVANRPLDTERSTIPNIPAMDRVGRALENLGSSFAEFGAHLEAKNKQKKDTEDAIAYETAVQKNQKDSYDTRNNNENPDGDGIYDQGIAAIDRNNAEAIAKMSPENQKIYGSKLEINKSDNGMWLEAQQHEQARGYYGDVTKGIVGNKAVDTGVNPHKWKEHLDDSYKFIDNLPNLYFAEKAALKKQAYQALAEGKIQGEIDKNPAAAKEHLGVPGQVSTSLSGAKVPSGSGNSGARAKQLAFVWHELAGPSGSHGGSSERAAFARLQRANSLEAAVSAGLTFERPSIPNYQGRLNHAKQVLAGRARPEAMQARAYFESKGMTPIQASGFVGVLIGESDINLNPHAANTNDPGTSIGIAQWNRDRKANMLAFTGGVAAEYMPDTGGLSKQEVDPAYAEMPTEWRVTQINRADNALNSANTAMTTSAKARVTQTFQDEYTARIQNGRYEGDTLTEQDFYEANPNDVGKAEESFGFYKRSMAEASKIHSFQGMTLNELSSQREKTMRMVGVGPGAAEEAAFQKDELAALDIATGKVQTQVKAVYDAQQQQMKTATEAAIVRAKEAEKYWEAKNKQQAADFKNIVEKQIKDQTSSYENDPAYLDTLMTSDVFQKIWPGKDGEDRYKAYQLGIAGAKMRSGFGDAPTRQLLAKQADLQTVIKGAAGQDTSALINEVVLTENAIKKELEAREKDPAGYVLLNNPVVATAFEEASKDPNSIKKSEYALKLMLANQRYIGVPEDKLAPLPELMVTNIVGPYNNPDANVLNATAPLIRAIELTTDKSARAAIMKQAIKGGIKSSASEGMIAYLDDRKPEAMRLFDAARVDDTLKGGQDDTKNSEINDKLYDILSSERARTEWGPGYQDSGQRAFDLQKLGFSYVKKAMFTGKTAEEAIAEFSKDVFGDKIPVVREFASGVTTNFSLPSDEDLDLIADGLANKQLEVENILKALIQGPPRLFELGSKEDRAIQEDIAKEFITKRMSQTGIWISYDDGFAFSTENGLLRNADGTFYKVTLDEAKQSALSIPVRRRGDKGGAIGQ